MKPLRIIASFAFIASSSNVFSFECVDSTLPVTTPVGNVGCDFMLTVPDSCDIDLVASHCPLSCDACDTYTCADSLFTLNTNGVVVTCAFIGSSAPQACANPAVLPTCAETCGYCATEEPSLSPSVPPTSEPTLPPTPSPTMTPTSAPTLPPTTSPTMVPSSTPTFPPTTSPTVVPSSTGCTGSEPLQEISIDFVDLLGCCQGDCDTDEECLPGLRCYHRNDNEVVPTCTGTATYSWDFCVEFSTCTGSETIVDVAIDPSDPLDCCEGDCDSDSDCLPGLYCTFRDGDEPVSDCQGNPTSGWDYCTQITNCNAEATDLGVNPVGPLDCCEGDCDTDDDCAPGLSCFQRAGDELVPGCHGTAPFGYDYCI